MLAIAIIFPTIKKYFAFIFNEEFSSTFHNISYVCLPNNVAIHLCLNMAKIYTSYQIYIELITSVTILKKLIHNILLENDRKTYSSESAYNMKSSMWFKFLLIVSWSNSIDIKSL